MPLLPLLVLSGCALGKLSSLGRSFPELEGELDAPGVGAPVTVIRDVYGVPHVRAGSETDAWYGLGFVHAQDRLFQLDGSRHLAWGRVSEWLGPDAVQFDLFVRALDLRALAEAHVAAAEPETRAMLEAYAAGINAGAAASRVLPIEYRLLRVPWEPYTAADAYATLFLLSWTLSDNLDFELAALALKDLDPADLDALLRTDPHSPPIDAYWDTLRKVDIGALTPAFTGFTAILGGAPARAEASNNWVIGGARTASGLPIVANDPHLSQRVPSLWYAADVAGGGMHVAGASIPGVPGIPIGHSERVAWGMTNVMADLVDLVVLARDGERGYVLAGETKPLREVEIEVPVRDRAPVKGTVWLTDVGPVITELGGTHLVAMRWATLEIADQLPSTLRRLNRAGSVAEALAQTREPLIVANNLVLGDVEGDFAWRPVGSLVGRRSHTGRVPYPGSEPDQGWSGWLDERPEEHRPERGYVITANSRPDHPLADAISTSYVPPHRFSRIDERIRAVDVHGPDDSHAIQTDVREMGAVWHRDRLLAGVEPTTDRGRTCRDLLVAWDLEANTGSVGASVWALFHEEYVRAAIVDDIGTARTELLLSIVGAGRSPLDGGGFDRFVEDRAATVSAALDAACARLTLTHGDDPAQWTWGRVHPLRLEHPFVSRAPKLLQAWNLIPVPFGGSGATVAAAAAPWGQQTAELPVGTMASLRMVMPLADLGASTLEHPGGQSGQPGNPLYASHYIHFVRGAPLVLWFDDDDVAANATDTSTLVPGE